MKAWGQGRIFKRRRTWWIAYCVDGQEFRESSGAPSEKDARRLLRQRLDEKAADRQGLRRFIGPAAERVRVGELLDALEEDHRLRTGAVSPQFRAHLAPVRETLGFRRAADVTAETVDRYVEERLRAGKAPATVNRETQLLGQAFRLGVRRGRLPAAPLIRRLPERNSRQGFFERGEFEAVVAALPQDLGDFARFGYLSGWRRGEIVSLRWSDVDRDGGVIRLRPEESKNGQGRVLALEGDLAAVVDRRWRARVLPAPGGAARVADLVFHREGRPIGDVRKAWATACKKAGVPGRLFHDLRRTAVRDMVRAGVPERVAMEVSGHRTRSVFDRYNIVSEDDLREAARRTSAYREARPWTRTVEALPSGAGAR